MHHQCKKNVIHIVESLIPIELYYSAISCEIFHQTIPWPSYPNISLAKRKWIFRYGKNGATTFQYWHTHFFSLHTYSFVKWILHIICIAKRDPTFDLVVMWFFYLLFYNLVGVDQCQRDGNTDLKLLHGSRTEAKMWSQLLFQQVAFSPWKSG